MIALSLELAAVGALILASLAVRTVSRNRHVRRRQRLTLLLALAWVAVEVVLAAGQYSTELSAQIRGLAQVALALAVINFLVVVAVNPLRDNRAPEHFPVILQDTVIVVLAAIVATAILRERILALSAVGAVVLGFALQDTLGNAFAGLAIQTEKPFNVGHWIRVADREGQVTEITWRATKLRTKENTFLIVPNNVMSREVVLNYSEPAIETRISIEVGATYEKPPALVKAAIAEAIRNSPSVLANPAPSILVVDFGPSAITYRARFWIDDYERDEVARDQVRTAIWYAFRRHDIEIPWPIQVEYSRQERPARPPETSSRFAERLSLVGVFAALDQPQRVELADAAVERLYAAGETIVREGEPGRSMFIVCQGEVEVVLEPGGQRVATIGESGYFGEMSLLTGAARSATVRAVVDSTLMEIGADEFRRFVFEKPAVLQRITDATLARRRELEQSRRSAEIASAADESPTTFFDRVRQFLRMDA